MFSLIVKCLCVHFRLTDFEPTKCHQFLDYEDINIIKTRAL